MLQTILAEVGIDLTTLMIMAAAAFVTAVFHSASGFAGALLLVIALAPLIGIKTAVPIVSVAVLISNATRLWLFRHELVMPVFISIIVTALTGMVIGALIFVYLPVDVIALLFGVFMIISVPGRRLMKNQNVEVGRLGFAAVGPVYGVVSGVTMGAGLLLAPFFLGAGIVGGRIAAMTAALGIVLNITRSIVFGASPLLNLPLIGVGLILGLCTSRTSARIHTLLVEAVMLAGAVFFFSQV